MNSRRKFEVQVLKWGLPAVIFLMPLLFSTKLHLAFVLPQTVFFRIAVTLFTILFLIYCVREKTFPSLRSLLRSSALVFFFLFFFVLILATIFGIAPIISFFGSYFRQQGLFTFLHYGLFFLLLLLTFQLIRGKEREHFFQRILFAFSLSGSLAALYGIFQKFGFDPFFKDFFTDFLFGRIFSTLGQPNLFGTWLLFPIAASMYFALRKERRQIIFGLIGLFLQTVSLTLTLSRAALLGFFVFLFSCLLIRLWEKVRKKLVFGIIIFLFIASLGMLILQGYRDAPFAKNPFIARFIFSGESLRSIESRLTIWNGTSRIFLDSPFLGYGPETLSMTFPKYQAAKLLDLESYTSIADRAHNIILDLLGTTGLFGALSFLFLLFSILYRTKNKETLPLRAGVIGFFISDLWGFELSVHTVALFTFLALLLMKTPKFRLSFQKITLSTRVLSVIIMFLLLPTIWYWNIQPLRADFAFQKDISEKAFVLNPFMPEYGLRYARSLSDPKETIQVLEKIIAISQYEIEVFPLLGKSYAKLGLMRSADEAFLEGVRLAPKSPLTLIPFAKTLFSQKRYEEAKQVYEYLLAISPRYWERSRESLEKQSFYEKERYRIFFKDNPEFLDILKDLNGIYKMLGDQGKADFYAASLAEIRRRN